MNDRETEKAEPDTLPTESSPTESSTRKVVGRPFPKGVSGNPGGRPRRETALVASRKVAQSDSENRTAPERRPGKRLFLPGQSGNPGGRPKTSSLSKALREKLEERFPDDPQGRTYAQVIAGGLVEQAAGGDLAAAREVADRAEGRPAQAVQIGVGTYRAVFEEYPPDETREEWLARMALEQARLADFEERDG